MNTYKTKSSEVKALQVTKNNLTTFETMGYEAEGDSDGAPYVVIPCWWGHVRAYVGDYVVEEDLLTYVMPEAVFLSLFHLRSISPVQSASQPV